MLRSLLKSLIAAGIALMLIAPMVMATSPVQYVSAARSTTDFGIPEENMPPNLGQSQIEAWVPESGHSVTGYMLDYWRANGAASVYGNPISQPFGASNQLYSQAFERGVFQYSPVWLYSDDAAVRLMPIVRHEMGTQRSARRSDGRRPLADRRAGMVPATFDSERSEQVVSEGGRFSASTGYSISGDFGAWYDNHEGWFYLGSPVSEPMRLRGVDGQMFENGILLKQDGNVSVAPLPREHPEKYGFNTAQIDQGGMPTYSESMFYSTWNPNSVDPTTIEGQKHIVVSISDQMMRVYQGDVLVLETYVSTGLSPNDTEIGAFHVRIKYESQTMEGFTDGSGEVISLGAEGDGEGESYSVSDVPHVMYINYEAEAIHGAYWHNNFGARMSHGCINLPLDVAAFLYEFSPLGTPVTVVE